MVWQAPNWLENVTEELEAASQVASDTMGTATSSMMETMPVLGQEEVVPQPGEGQGHSGHVWTCGHVDMCGLLLTVRAANLAGVVRVESGKAGRGVDVQVDRLSQLQKGDVVGTCVGAAVALVDDRLQRQGDNFPDNNQVLNPILSM